ncbi:VOC family protein [Nocardioides massiliensis]|uniref:Enzyme related to lactoylglutathione lyase n=1 Tax=Nocardioides massiliensis TaxID=1325935 RepID=A0ABT9NPA7_9ACTN|nr:VOC family protein [Nocardioides massiliensis]MDP9822223.1 putative enzyme related to lactoylglutathione lyase [Nocardioides massiliensis]
MTSVIVQTTIDVQDVERMAAFWSQALGYAIVRNEGGSCHLVPPQDAPIETPTIWLQPSAGPKTTKNRTHLDLRPANGDVDAEAERLLSLGASHVDVGQSAEDPFVVLADPEGNEFCILRREQSEVRARG